MPEPAVTVAVNVAVAPVVTVWSVGCAVIVLADPAVVTAAFVPGYVAPVTDPFALTAGGFPVP